VKTIFGKHFFRPDKQEQNWVKTILSAKFIERFVGGGTIIRSAPGLKVPSLQYCEFY